MLDQHVAVSPCRPHAPMAQIYERFLYAREGFEGPHGQPLGGIPKDQTIQNLMAYLATHLATKTKQLRDIASELRTFGGRYKI